MNNDEIKQAQEVIDSARDKGGPATRDWADIWAQDFHDTYERAAPKFGYETRTESAKPWSEVPKKNKSLMRAVCAEVLCRFLNSRAVASVEGTGTPKPDAMTKMMQKDVAPAAFRDPIPDGERMSASNQEIVTQDRIIEDRNRDIIDLMASLWKPFYSKDDTDGRCASCHHYAESYKEFLTEVPHHKDCKFRAVIGRHNWDASSLRGEGTRGPDDDTLLKRDRQSFDAGFDAGKQYTIKAAESREEKLRELLPATYFADRDTLFRLEQIVDDWRKLTNTNQALEEEIEKLRECLRELREALGTIRSMAVLCDGKCKWDHTAAFKQIMECAETAIRASQLLEG